MATLKTKTRNKDLVRFVFCRHLKLFQDQLLYQAQMGSFFCEDMKIEAHVVRKECIDMTNYANGSFLGISCLKCASKSSFHFYPLPAHVTEISGRPIAVSKQSLYPPENAFFCQCWNISQ
jgi:hypothetical protein